MSERLGPEPHEFQEQVLEAIAEVKTELDTEVANENREHKCLWKSWEALMLKPVVIAIIAALPLLFGAGEVSAITNGVQCPVGTCNYAGGHFASDVKYCKPSYCKKDSPK